MTESQPFLSLLMSLLPLAILIGLIFLLLNFFLRRSHKGMDKSIEMQKDAMKSQSAAIKMGLEGIELQKEMLSELREIKKLLEKR